MAAKCDRGVYGYIVNTEIKPITVKEKP